MAAFRAPKQAGHTHSESSTTLQTIQREKERKVISQQEHLTLRPQRDSKSPVHQQNVTTVHPPRDLPPLPPLSLPAEQRMILSKEVEELIEKGAVEQL